MQTRRYPGTGMSSFTKPHILIPRKCWTPIRNEVFAEHLGEMEEPRSGLLYQVFYDRAWHQEPRHIRASVAEIGRWTKMDTRTVSKCLEELEDHALIVRVRNGVNHSRIRVPSWRVPLTEFSLGDAAWTPVPRFLITRYLPKFPNAALLPLIIYYQHMSWQNKAWVGIATICKRIGWSPTRARKALRIMGHQRLWEQEKTELPWPLEISYYRQPTGEERRRFRVRAIWYDRVRKKGGGYSTLCVSKEFRARFKVPKNSAYEP